MTTRKETEHLARQRFVLDAARRVYAAEGVENTSMEDIAAAAGYTRRSLYNLFRGHDEISIQVLCEDLSTRWAVQKEALAGVDTGLEKIVIWAEELYRYSRENLHSLHLQLYWDLKGIREDRIGKDVFSQFERINSDLATGLRGIFHLGVSDGSLRPDLNVDMCISHFLYTLRSVIHRALSPTYSFAEFDPDDYVASYLDLFSRAICLS
ncbi:TetR/AcrR family transcriptional regulator [Candidatus Eisenbacteria bacterium]|uniref:TetR/AcrR family transcriptional regulator n=1 Tax=Eiseniibacteriota bacterium TaxID=2212470 RepID=A0ABV6YMJ2_UNCEI